VVSSNCCEDLIGGAERHEAEGQPHGVALFNLASCASAFNYVIQDIQHVHQTYLLFLFLTLKILAHCLINLRYFNR
jgi:hypothetical protein